MLAQSSLPLSTSLPALSQAPQDRPWILQQVLPPRIAHQDALKTVRGVRAHCDRRTCRSILGLILLYNNQNSSKDQQDKN